MHVTSPDNKYNFLENKNQYHNNKIMQKVEKILLNMFYFGLLYLVMFSFTSHSMHLYVILIKYCTRIGKKMG